MIDLDKDGQITIEEFREAFEDQSEDKEAESFWKAIIQKADKNKDGLISFSEFYWALMDQNGRDQD